MRPNTAKYMRDDPGWMRLTQSGGGTLLEADSTGPNNGARFDTIAVLQGVAPTAVVHGQMVRQADTAAAMVDGGDWPVNPELDEGWNEFDVAGLMKQISAPAPAPIRMKA